jgi:hypothetical protein
MNMRKTILSLIPVLVLITVVFQSCQSTQKTSSGQVMKFNLQKGKIYDYDMAFDIDQQMQGQTMEINMKSGYTLEVVDEAGDVKNIKTTFGRIVMDMSGVGPMKMTVDTDESDIASKDEVSQVMHKVLKAMVGKSFMMKVNSEGKVLEFSGFAEVRNAIVQSLGLEGQDAKDAELMSGQVMNDDNLRKSFEQAFFIFPNKEVKVGDTWTKEMQMGGMMPLKVSSTYTVKSIEGDHATLSMDGTISSTSEAAKMNGTQNGTMIVDLKTGLVVNSDFNQDFSTTTPEGTISSKSKGHITGKAR